MSKSLLKFVISLVFGIGLLIFTVRHFDLQRSIESMRFANHTYLLLALFLLLLAYVLRGRRWIIWDTHLSFWQAFKIILVGFMGNNILPARLGEILRAHCAAAGSSNRYGRTAALASIVIERILDGFMLSIVGIVGLALVPMNHFLFWSLASVCGMFFLCTAGLILSINIHQKIRWVLIQLERIFPNRYAAFVKEKTNYFLDGLLLVQGYGRISGALLATALIWGVELLMYHLIAAAVFPGISIKVSLVFLAVVNFASLFPLTVGGIGAIEGATVLFLLNVGVPKNEALAMVLIQHGYQFAVITSLGITFYFSGRYYLIPIFKRNRNHGGVPHDI